MTTISLLDKLQDHAFDMIKFGEAKNTVLIAFNGAIIVGMSKLANDTPNSVVHYYSIFVISMCAISAFICFSALIAKIKDKPSDFFLPKNDNPLFFATVAYMTQQELLEKLIKEYQCTNENTNYEKDLARQAIVTSQIASRKFKLFNIAIGFTFCGITTPISILIYKLFLDHDK